MCGLLGVNGIEGGGLGKTSSLQAVEGVCPRRGNRGKMCDLQFDEGIGEE